MDNYIDGVKNAVNYFEKYKACYTSLDVFKEVKSDFPNVTFREVKQVLSNTVGNYSAIIPFPITTDISNDNSIYFKSLIDVVLEDGSSSKTWLYHPNLTQDRIDIEYPEINRTSVATSVVVQSALNKNELNNDQDQFEEDEEDEEDEEFLAHEFDVLKNNTQDQTSEEEKLLVYKNSFLEHQEKLKNIKELSSLFSEYKESEALNLIYHNKYKEAMQAELEGRTPPLSFQEREEAKELAAREAFQKLQVDIKNKKALLADIDEDISQAEKKKIDTYIQQTKSNNFISCRKNSPCKRELKPVVNVNKSDSGVRPLGESAQVAPYRATTANRILKTAAQVAHTKEDAEKSKIEALQSRSLLDMVKLSLIKWLSNG